MKIDYRNTLYCPDLNDLTLKKDELRKRVLMDHPDATDMHRFVSKNGSIYKKEFMKAYNFKCCYCGVSVEVCSINFTEIDHVIHKKSKKFNNISESGYMDNLVLSCYTCNRKKGALLISDDDLQYLHPDSAILNVFHRNDDYYIKIKDEYKSNKIISSFYKKLAFNSEMLRIDYLLMNMIGLLRNINENTELHGQLSSITNKLQLKRNQMKRD